MDNTQAVIGRLLRQARGLTMGMIIGRDEDELDGAAKAIEEQKAKLEQAEAERIRRVAEADAIWAEKTARKLSETPEQYEARLKSEAGHD